MIDYLWFWIARELASLVMFVGAIAVFIAIGLLVFAWDDWTTRPKRKEQP